MKVVRSIPALSRLTGVEAPLEELVALLFNVSTTEELVISEQMGAYFPPVDRPGEYYLFAAGKGVVALVAPKMTEQLFAMDEKNSAKKEFAALDEEYKSLALEGQDWESEFQEIATDYVKWACEQEGR
ncbi:hypothetical protein LMH87_001599 [Akanthomyces muscarius]|uniref:Uncharacterized protein n=1 Tax=Akanthomyces muscarius TaxID=2231603 RepID=A0A9W8Q7X0_AKAMU|nr:hypothetical protein LMH87_001599 [Akanthomyces muscarius]KAJ4147046.1 hypothetical protein LMH87_001599 [Akanthomyces muscarius]